MAEQIGREAELRPDEAQGEHGGHRRDGDRQGLSQRRGGEADEGVRRAHLHSGEEAKGQRNWTGKRAEQQAVYANRRRVRGEYGKSLLRRRGELVERSFAHCYETGGMRRAHLRGHENILKRQLIHVGAFNLSLILRKLLGAGTPREWKNHFVKLIGCVLGLFWQGNGQPRFGSSRISTGLPHPSQDRAPDCAAPLAGNQILARRAVRG